MKLYESYVAEAQARRRRRLAIGIVGAVMLGTVALTALVLLAPTGSPRGPLSAGCDMPGSNTPACARSGLSG